MLISCICHAANILQMSMENRFCIAQTLFKFAFLIIFSFSGSKVRTKFNDNEFINNAGNILCGGGQNNICNGGDLGFTLLFSLKVHTKLHDNKVM